MEPAELYADMERHFPEMLEAAKKLTEAAVNRDPGDACDCERCRHVA